MNNDANTACLDLHPDDYGPIVRRCRRARFHDGQHSSTDGLGSDKGDRWTNLGDVA